MNGITGSTLLRSASFRQGPLRSFRTYAPLCCRQGEGDQRVPRLTLYTGTDCQLCDVAKAEIERLKKEVPPFDFSLFNIRDDSLPDVQRWRRAYQYDIPVLHLDGQEVARHRIRRDELAHQIRRAAAISAEE